MASRKKTSRNPADSGVTSCQDNPPSSVRRTNPPPTKSKPPTAKAMSGSIASRPLKVKSEITSCTRQVLPPSVEREKIPLLQPKYTYDQTAHQIEVSAIARDT